MAKNIGKFFEDKVQKSLKELQAIAPCMYYRFPDATSARNAMTSQPGDHMLLCNGTAWLIEEKASDVHESFVSGASSLAKKKQAASHVKWRRSGNKSIYLFHSSLSKVVEVWDGEYVATRRAQGKQLRVEDGLLLVGYLELLTEMLKNCLIDGDI